MNKKTLIYLSLVCLAACSTSPTGRSQFIAFSDGQMAAMGAESFSELKTQGKVVTDKQLNDYVNCISGRLLNAIGEKPRQWEVKIFRDDSLNAFALPGKKIGIHTGMIQFATADELAAVVGHEIGHVQARHGAERMTMGMANQVLMASSAVLLENSEYKQYAGLAVSAMAIGAQYGVILPYNRAHESEADAIGLSIAAKAGFNPEAAVSLWHKMKKVAKGAPPEFMSTHPAHDTRIRQLQAQLPNVEKIYQLSKQNSQCIKP